MKYALQLYSIKNISETQGLEASLKLASELGYDSVEFAGFYDKTVPEVLELLKKYNLEVAGMHYGLGEIQKDVDAAVNLAKELGAYSVCVPWYQADSTEGWIDFAKQLNEVGKAYKKAGILFGYHNHRHEFVEIDGKYPMDLILENSDAENVFFELDARHAAIAGVNPAEYAKKYAGRIPVLHARDAENEVDCTVGQGVVNFPALVKNAEIINVFIVENENFGVNQQQLSDSVTYLKKNF